ncbi:MAG: hypothetical protein ACE15E_21980 [Acidobacteriota bacterium]
MSRRKAEAALRQILRDFSPATSEDWKIAEAKCLPVEFDKTELLSYMTFFSLVLVVGCTYADRPMEKTSWAILVRFRGVLFDIELGKFGLRIKSEKPADRQITEELVAKLRRSMPLMDVLLDPVIAGQVQNGAISLPNYYHVLLQRYEFFRDLAIASFNKPVPPFPLQECKSGKAVPWDLYLPDREGFYYGSAAIDSFFSWLEHLLLLVLPFVCQRDVPLLMRLMASSWDRRLRVVWDLKTDRKAKCLYDSLKAVKERFRNSVAHGYLEKGSRSFQVHVPGYGAVPASLSGFTRTIHYSVFPLPAASFTEVISLFDAVSRYLEEGPSHFGFLYAESGLPVHFDERSCRQYSEAMTSHEQFQRFLDRESYFQAQATNMDW